MAAAGIRCADVDGLCLRSLERKRFEQSMRFLAAIQAREQQHPAAGAENFSRWVAPAARRRPASHRARMASRGGEASRREREQRRRRGASLLEFLELLPKLIASSPIGGCAADCAG